MKVTILQRRRWAAIDDDDDDDDIVDIFLLFTKNSTRTINIPQLSL